MGRSRFLFHEKEYPYFVTSSIIDDVPLCSDPAIATIILDSLAFIQDQFEVIVYGYVIMENPMHAILDSPTVSEDLRRMKSYTAKKIIQNLESRGRTKLLDKLRFVKKMHKHQSEYQVWQEGVHPKQIESHQKMAQCLEYIHNNPVKAGFVDDPIHWRYSSARNYDAETGLIDVTLFEG